LPLMPQDNRQRYLMTGVGRPEDVVEAGKAR
jgi:hypothetical protein